MMNIPLTAVPTLRAGDKLTQDEFLRRWEAMPNVKRAELIGGVVYMPSPVSWDHGTPSAWVTTWLGLYRMVTPGVEVCQDTTWIMGSDVAQPDAALFIHPHWGGRAHPRGRLLAGVPEFVAETSVTSAAHDLGEKRRLYERQGVQEYLTLLVDENEVRWHGLEAGHYVVVPLPSDGIYRSAVLPGLWLDAAALLAGDLVRVHAVLAEGTHSAEHRDFVARLAAQRRP